MAFVFHVDNMQWFRNNCLFVHVVKEMWSIDDDEIYDDILEVFISKTNESPSILKHSHSQSLIMACSELLYLKCESFCQKLKSL